MTDYTPPIRIMRDLVLVEPQERSESKLIISVAKEGFQIGKVVAVGCGSRNEDGTRAPVEMQVGQTVTFAENIGEPCKVDGRSYFIIKEEDIDGVIE